MLNQHDISCFRIVLCHEFDCENKEHQIKEEQKFIDELKPKLNKINSSGNKCEHNKLRSKCKECKGGSICIHNRQKSFCKECGGSEICEHNQYKSKCKDCGGSQICIHDRQKSQCKECKGSQICEHNQYKSRCKECKGSQICVHDKIKSRCRECGGSCTQKVKCECGSEVRKDGMIKHMKTKKHQDFIHPEK
jgi:hypothetical protein